MDYQQKLSRLANQTLLQRKRLTDPVLSFQSFSKKDIIIRKGDFLDLCVLIEGVVGQISSAAKILPFEVDRNFCLNDLPLYDLHRNSFKILCFNELCNKKKKTADNFFVCLSNRCQVAVIRGLEKERAIHNIQDKYERLKGFLADKFGMPSDLHDLFYTIKQFVEVEKPGKSLIVQEGQKSEALLILVKGQVALFKKAAVKMGQSKMMPISTMQKPGEIISNPLTYATHKFSVTSTTNVSLLQVNRHVLNKLPKNWLELCSKSLQSMTENREQRFLKSKHILIDASSPAARLSSVHEKNELNLEAYKRSALKSTYSFQEDRMQIVEAKYKHLTPICNVLTVCVSQVKYKHQKKREMLNGLRKFRRDHRALRHNDTGQKTGSKGEGENRHDAFERIRRNFHYM